MARLGKAGHGEARRSRSGMSRRGDARLGEAVSTNRKDAEMGSKFATRDRQKIIDGYLSETGRNMFIPGEFIDWLSGKPEHEAYSIFFGTSDEAAARQYRIDLARRMASGLRIVARSEPSKQSKVVQITTREYPAYVSPVAGRKDGGGYQPFDPSDAASMSELQSQAAGALRGWLTRYRGAAEAAGADVTPIEEIVEHLSRDVAQSA